MVFSSIYDLLRAEIPDLPPVVVFPTPSTTTASDSETKSQPSDFETIVTATDPRNPESETPVAAAADCASANSTQQSKVTTNCSETTPNSATQNPEHGSRNPKEQSLPDIC